MNLREAVKQNLIDLANHLEEMVSSTEQPAAVDWRRIKKEIDRDVLYLRDFVIPEVSDPEPGYKSGNGTTPAQYVPRPVDTEVKLDDSSAIFMPTGNAR